jgi:hypothetical protein
MPGRASENALAASITPAPKPNIVSCVRCAMVRANSAGKVPAAVAPAATQPLRKAAKMGEVDGITRGQCAPEVPAEAMGKACGFPYETLERVQAWSTPNRWNVNVGYHQAAACRDRAGLFSAGRGTTPRRLTLS